MTTSTGAKCSPGRSSKVRGEFTAMAWQVFWNAGVEGKSAGEVARELNVTVGTVYQYKSRIMARLRQKIGQVEGERWTTSGNLR
ncbi:RNA polymerase sigma factor [Singulisphaera sp. PoT]|uniref:RNA polymerase sigma factor n=1 Tax=Singulisphaera sp. PoT TaxID=3411797 RepID=UPI003BF54B9C